MGFVRRYASRASVACDIGTNTGWYALYFATLQKIERVHAFDPDESLVVSARATFLMNDPAYLAKTEFHAKFVGDKDDSRWCRLDTVLRGIRRPIVLKIDVDGGELEVLHGAKEILSEVPCMLVIETHSVELERGCVDFLDGLGYRTRIIKNGWYRAIVPETRNLPHNRWMTAERP